MTQFEKRVATLERTVLGKLAKEEDREEHNELAAFLFDLDEKSIVIDDPVGYSCRRIVSSYDEYLAIKQSITSGFPPLERFDFESVAAAKHSIPPWEISGIETD